MGEKIESENSLSKVKSLIRMWLLRKDSKLVLSSINFKELYSEGELSDYFQSLSYDGRIITQVLMCQKCGILMSTNDNRKYNLKRHLKIHNMQKTKKALQDFNEPLHEMAMSLGDNSIDSGMDSTPDTYSESKKNAVACSSPGPSSKSPADLDVWFDALESL